MNDYFQFMESEFSKIIQKISKMLIDVSSNQTGNQHSMHDFLINYFQISQLQISNAN